MYLPRNGSESSMNGIVKHCGIDAPTEASYQELREVMILAFGKDEVVARSLEQNDCLHTWCRKIRDHLVQSGVPITEETVKELILNGLGNKKLIDNVPGLPPKEIAMRSHKYKQLDSDLSPAELKAGFISMNELLSKVEVWAATDLGLDLSEEQVTQEYKRA